LPVQVSAAFADTLFAAIMADPKTEINVDLPNQKVTLVATGKSEPFVINTYKKDNMLNGFDDIDYLKNIEGEITEFAKTRPF
jgi:3-isopropylmalate/(R)-2-methylmalate dehydratase small subunit